MYDTPHHVDDATKHLVDMISLITVLGTLIDMLPAIAAGLSILWTFIRIYETDTVQRFLNRRPPRADDK